MLLYSYVTHCINSHIAERGNGFGDSYMKRDLIDCMQSL